MAIRNAIAADNGKPLVQSQALEIICVKNDVSGFSSEGSGTAYGHFPWLCSTLPWLRKDVIDC